MAKTTKKQKGIVLHEVTWYSRVVAIVLFICVLPAIAFYFGVEYGRLLPPEEIRAQQAGTASIYKAFLSAENNGTGFSF